MTKEKIIEITERAIKSVNGYYHDNVEDLYNFWLKEWGIFDSDVGDVSKAIRARGNHD